MLSSVHRSSALPLRMHFEYFGDPETKETELFVRVLDRLFDCLNVRSPTEWYEKKEDSLKPYTSLDTSLDNTRLKVHGIKQKA